jgi:hypothetical protein
MEPTAHSVLVLLVETPALRKAGNLQANEGNSWNETSIVFQEKHITHQFSIVPFLNTLTILLG